jgi:hypothetical protein
MKFREANKVDRKSGGSPNHCGEAGGKQSKKIVFVPRTLGRMWGTRTELLTQDVRKLGEIARGKLLQRERKRSSRAALISCGSTV